MLRATCVLLGVFAALIGIHDVFAAAAGYQLLGGVLFVLGLLACAAIVPLGSWVIPASVISLSGASVIALIFFFGATLNLSKQQDWRLFVQLNWRLLVWALVLLIVLTLSGIALRAILRSVTLPRRLGALALIPSIGGAGAVAGAIAQFVYATQLAPLVSSPSFGVQAELHQVGRAQHVVVVSGTIKVHNAGDTRTSVLSSLYRVQGFKVGSRDQDLQADWNSALEREPALTLKGDRAARLRASPGPPVLLQLGRIVPATWTFDKGEDYNRTFVVYVPDDYNLVRLTVEMAGAKNSILQLDPRNSGPIWDDPKGESGNNIRVVESSWYQQFTQPPRIVADRWWFGDRKSLPPWEDPSLPTIDPCIYFENAPLCDTGNSLKFLGLVQTSTQFEMWLSPATS